MVLSLKSTFGEEGSERNPREKNHFLASRYSGCFSRTVALRGSHQGKVAVQVLCCSQEKYILQQGDWAGQRCLLGRTSAPAPHPLPMNCAMILHDAFWARWNFFFPS